MPETACLDFGRRRAGIDCRDRDVRGGDLREELVLQLRVAEYAQDPEHGENDDDERGTFDR
jgi:hypothetical protein